MSFWLKISWVFDFCQKTPVIGRCNKASLRYKYDVLTKKKGCLNLIRQPNLFLFSCKSNKVGIEKSRTQYVYIISKEKNKIKITERNFSDIDKLFSEQKNTAYLEGLMEYVKLTEESFQKYKNDGRTSGILKKTLPLSINQSISKKGLGLQLTFYIHPNGDIVSRSFAISSNDIDKLQIEDEDLVTLKNYISQLRVAYKGPSLESNSILYYSLILP